MDLLSRFTLEGSFLNAIEHKAINFGCTLCVALEMLQRLRTEQASHYEGVRRMHLLLIIVNNR